MSARQPSERVGDFLVASRDPTEASVGRTNAAWDLVHSSEAGTAHTQRPAPGWTGYPFHAVRLEGWHLWLLGEMYGTDGDLDRALLGFASHPEAPPEANGHFLVFGLDAATRTWHAWTDRFGTLHAYHAWNGEQGSIGTSSRAVAALASRKELDWLGWTGFFAFGFFPGDRTQLEDVRILRPASHYVFDPRGRLLTKERYWRWRHEPRHERSYDRTLGELRDLLSEVMRDLTSRGTVALPISGGLDSRTTVAALARRDGLHAYSYGYSSDSEETKIASQVALARDLPFRDYVIGPYLFDELPRVQSAVEGFQDVTQSRQAAVVEDLASRADAVIAAHWGDVWLDDMGWPGRESGGDPTSHALGKILKGGREWLLEHLCRGRTGEPIDEILRDAVRSELEPLVHLDDEDFRIKAFKTEQWSFRWTTASLRAFQIGLFPRLPFYDTRIADFLCTVPTEAVRGRRLQIDYLKRYAPDLAAITWQAVGTSLTGYRYFDTLLLPKRAVAKLKRMATGVAPIERNWEVQFLGERGRRELERRLAEGDRPLHELVPPAAVRALLDDFFREPFEGKRGYTISMLLTFADWLERSLG